MRKILARRTLAMGAMILILIGELSLAEVHLHDAWARPNRLPHLPVAIYLTVHNGANTEDTLTGLAWAGGKASLELHTTDMQNGMMRMRKVALPLTLAPDEALQLSPGGHHLMLIDPGRQFTPGDSLSLALEFEKAGRKNLTVEVRDDGKRQHKHHH